MRGALPLLLDGVRGDGEGGLSRVNNDLISREALLEKIRDQILEDDEVEDKLDMQYNRGLLRAIKVVKRAPAVDAKMDKSDTRE